MEEVQKRQKHKLTAFGQPQSDSGKLSDECQGMQEGNFLKLVALILLPHLCRWISSVIKNV